MSYLTVLEDRSPTWVSLGYNQGVSKAVSSAGPRDNLFPCFFHLLEDTLIPLHMIPSSIFKSLSESDLTLLLPTFTYEDPWDGTGSIQIIQDNLPSQGQLVSNLQSICKLNFPLPCNVTHSTGLGD